MLMAHSILEAGMCRSVPYIKKDYFENMSNLVRERR